MVLIVDVEGPGLLAASWLIRTHLPSWPWALASRQDVFAGSVEDDYDVILSELKMPHLEGLSLLNHVRAARPSVAVVFMTREAGKLGHEALASGAFAVLHKPLQPTTLVETLEAALTYRQTLSQQNRTAPDERHEAAS